MERVLTRKEEIVLNGIIRELATGASQVTSQQTIRSTGLALSPSSMRNIMRSLQDKGFLTTDNLYAGKRPTNLGYRYYIRYLFRPLYLTEDKKRQIRDVIIHRLTSVSRLLDGTSELLATLSDQIALVVAPLESSAKLHRIELLKLGSKRVLLLLITDTGSVSQYILKTEIEPSDGTLKLLVNILNERLFDIPLHKLKTCLLTRFEDINLLERRFCQTIERMLPERRALNDENIYIKGAENLLAKPEFKKPDNIRRLLALIETRDELAELAFSDSPRDEIVAEIGCGILDSMSVIRKHFKGRNKEYGVVSIIGTVRMDYRKVIPLIEYTGKLLDELFQ